MPRRAAQVRHEPPAKRNATTAKPKAKTRRPPAPPIRWPPVPASRRGSVKWAWNAVNRLDERLLSDAIRRGLLSRNPGEARGWVELGARLNKEVGPVTDVAAGVAVILVGSGAEAVQAYQAAAARVLEAGPAAEEDEP
jgi:hypothetical protein